MNTHHGNAKITIFFIDIFVILLVLASILPILYIVSLSLSSNDAVLAQKVFLWPVGFNINSYKLVFSDPKMMNSLLFTIILVLIYTVLSMVMNILAAYPLSRNKLPGKRMFMIIIIITMFFRGGLIPEYLWIKQLGLVDKPLVLILPVLINSYYLIILKNFFSDVPISIEEAAIIDGASIFRTLIEIVLPLTLPALATISLFYAVFRWNNLNDALYYIESAKYYPLQLKLYYIVFGASLDVGQLSDSATVILPETLKAASSMFATIPILVLYPFLQKYFIAGITVGAVKG